MTIQLQAKTREITGKKVNQLRTAGLIPAVIYGRGQKNKNLELNYNAFKKAYHKAGSSTLVDLAIDGAEPVKVVVADVQTDPVKGQVSHVDFHQIRMDEKMTAYVEIGLVGEAPAVKEGGVLIHALNEIEIRCLPADLIHNIEVDISKLKHIGDSIMVSDLDLPKSVEIIGHENDEVVANIIEQKIEEIPTEAPEDESEVEGQEGEEGAEATGDKEGEGKEGEEKVEGAESKEKKES